MPARKNTGNLQAGVRKGPFRLMGGQAAVERIKNTLFGAMLYAASAPEGSIGAGELEGKWKNFPEALT